jgi:putative transposase
MAFTRPKSSTAADHGAPTMAVEFDTLEPVDWFNHPHLLEPIGNIPPAEAEQQYYGTQECLPMAA